MQAVGDVAALLKTGDEIGIGECMIGEGVAIFEALN